MSEELIKMVRDYIEDNKVPYIISDTVIERMPNKSRIAVYELPISAEYDNGKVYNIGHKYLMNVVVSDGTNIIDPSNYEIDVFNGIITFDSAPTTGIYVSFTKHDFFNAVADLWKYRAGLSRFSGRVKLGDEDLPDNANSREYCIRKYWDYRTARTIQTQR